MRLWVVGVYIGCYGLLVCDLLGGGLGCSYSLCLWCCSDLSVGLLRLLLIFGGGVGLLLLDRGIYATGGIFYALLCLFYVDGGLRSGLCLALFCCAGFGVVLCLGFVVCCGFICLFGF